jgi:hypothetical protein
MHGLTAQHLANEPHLPVGKGRYGSLIPAAVKLFQAAAKTSAKGIAPARTRRTSKKKQYRSSSENIRGQVARGVTGFSST